VRFVPPDPSNLDLAVERLIIEELAPYRRSASVARGWSDEAGMWFTEARPRNPAAATISVAVHDTDTINVTVGNIWFELFGPATEHLPHLREIVAAVVAGAVEEAGSSKRAYGRIRTETETVRVGHVHFGPSHWRRYESYGYRA
jgi:hypothetical protein